MCCSRDEIYLEKISCIPYGDVGAGCTTVISDTYCPCVDGLVCKPHVISSDFHSIYGNCHNTSVHDVTTTESDFTTEVTTTEGHEIIVNHPPVIHINHLTTPYGKIAVVPVDAKVGQEIAHFTVLDNDKGKRGKITCSILQPWFLRVVKRNASSYKIVVAFSILHLSTQTLTAYIICADGSKSHSNNVAMLQVKITREVQTTSEFIGSETTESSEAFKKSTIVDEYSTTRDVETTSVSIGDETTENSETFKKSTIFDEYSKIFTKTGERSSINRKQSMVYEQSSPSLIIS